MTKDNNILVFGEVLFDTFGPDDVVLGGAPFNVAWHLQGFGLKPIFISRIGNDPNGQKVIQNMKTWGMSTTAIQYDDKYPTGIVSVSTKNGEPTFDIRSEQAYDFIDYNDIPNHIKENTVSIIYHGILALRNEFSYNTLKLFKSKSNGKIFLDVNLRDPWWNQEIIVQQMSDANWVKCNSNELKIIGQAFKIYDENLSNLANQICKESDLEFLIVTLGDKGAFIINQNGKINTVAQVPVSEVVDTVGAGDAFSAVSILGIVNKWPKHIILERAIEFAAKMCQTKGATLNNKKYYQFILKKWNN